MNTSYFDLKRHTAGMEVNLLLFREEHLTIIFYTVFCQKKMSLCYILGFDKQCPDVIEDFFQIVGGFL